MTKTFPKSRICVLDIYPSFEKGLKQAMLFANKHHVELGSNDGKRIILKFCLDHIENFYKQTQSPFPKVLCIAQKPITKKIKYFIETHFDNMMNFLPFPYCGKYDLNSPDLEHAAERSLKAQKTQHNFQKFLNTLNLRSVDK